MEEQLVSLKTAKQAKKAGFKERCHYFFNEGSGWKVQEDYMLRQDKIIEAPTQSLLQKWLREVHQIYVQIETDQTTYPKFCYSISRFIGNPNNLSEKEWYWDKLPYNENWSLHREYEEALEEGLQEALKMVR